MSRLVDQARTYLGVPFRHRGRSELGLDCAGLGVRVYADLGVTLPDVERYGREPHKNGLMQALETALGAPLWLGQVGEVVDRALLQPGDVVVIRFELQPHHVAFIGDDARHGLSLIHSYAGLGVGKVVEHGLDPSWQALICAVFRRPV